MSQIRSFDQHQNATAVIAMAEHMDRLREEALRLRACLKTGQRGYFTPSEVEQVDHLWISYHKTRSALLEVIDTARRTVRRPDRHTVNQFAVAYAAAVVLVDAARFLRDLFSEDLLVRRKLNESYERYGIQAGSFDRIQMSLTAPANAVGLARADRFYERHASHLRQLSDGDAQLQSLLDVIDRRLRLVQIAKLQYVSARVAERRRELVEQVIQGGVARALYSLQEIASRLIGSISTQPGHCPGLPESIAIEFKRLIRAGDVFVTRKDNALTNYFLPGYWPHVAFYIGNNRLVESLKDGVRDRPIDSAMSNDAVTVIRPLLSKTLIQQSVARATSHVGKPYDFDFDFTRADRMVCTEVVYRSLEGLGGIDFQLTRRAGRETLSAEDLLRMALQGKHFQPIAGYCRQHHEGICRDQQLVSILQATLGTA